MLSIKDRLYTIETQAIDVQGLLRALELVIDEVQSEPDGPRSLRAKHACSALTVKVTEDFEALLSAIGDLALDPTGDRQEATPSLEDGETVLDRARSIWGAGLKDCENCQHPVD